jgi:hypothetical protein
MDMGTIYWRRVLLGGIVAGAVIDLLQYLLHGVVLAPEWRQFMQSIGRPLEETLGRIVFYTVLGLPYGLMATLIYASIRPRFGTGPLTAFYAGATVWILAFFLPTMLWLPMGLFPTGLATTAMMVELLIVMVATEAGVWVYSYETPAAGSKASRRAA